MVLPACWQRPDPDGIVQEGERAMSGIPALELLCSFVETSNTSPSLPLEFVPEAVHRRENRGQTPIFLAGVSGSRLLIDAARASCLLSASLAAVGLAA